VAEDACINNGGDLASCDRRERRASATQAQRVAASVHARRRVRLITASICGIQQSPKFYPEPNCFQPERFMERSAPYTFIPFGGGDRGCIGASFALMEIKSVLRTLLKRVELRVTSSRDERSNPLRGIAIVRARGVRVLAAARHGE
jgi:cytochrome P450